MKKLFLSLLIVPIILFANESAPRGQVIDNYFHLSDLDWIAFCTNWKIKNKHNKPPIVNETSISDANHTPINSNYSTVKLFDFPIVFNRDTGYKYFSLRKVGSIGMFEFVLVNESKKKGFRFIKNVVTFPFELSKYDNAHHKELKINTSKLFARKVSTLDLYYLSNIYSKKSPVCTKATRKEDAKLMFIMNDWFEQSSRKPTLHHFIKVLPNQVEFVEQRSYFKQIIVSHVGEISEASYSIDYFEYIEDAKYMVFSDKAKNSILKPKIRDNNSLTPLEKLIQEVNSETDVEYLKEQLLFLGLTELDTIESQML